MEGAVAISIATFDGFRRRRMFSFVYIFSKRFLFRVLTFVVLLAADWITCNSKPDPIIIENPVRARVTTSRRLVVLNFGLFHLIRKT